MTRAVLAAERQRQKLRVDPIIRPRLLRSQSAICSLNGITLHQGPLFDCCRSQGCATSSVRKQWSSLQPSLRCGSSELRTTTIRTCEAYSGRREPSTGSHLELIGLANRPLSSGGWALQRRLGKARLLDGNSAAPTQLAQQNTELLPLVGCCFARSAESTDRT